MPTSRVVVADTRPDSTVGTRNTPHNADETYTLDGWGAVGNCALPSNTWALQFNVTAVGATAPTFIAFFPCGAVPTASNLNPEPDRVSPDEEAPVVEG